MYGLTKLNRDPKIKSRHLTLRELAFVAGYADKHGQSKAVKDLKVSSTTTLKALRIFGFSSKPNGSPPQYSEEERAKWLAFEGGLKKASIFFGVSTNTIRHEIRRKSSEGKTQKRKAGTLQGAPAGKG